MWATLFLKAYNDLYQPVDFCDSFFAVRVSGANFRLWVAVTED